MKELFQKIGLDVLHCLQEQNGWRVSVNLPPRLQTAISANIADALIARVAVGGLEDNDIAMETEMNCNERSIISVNAALVEEAERSALIALQSLAPPTCDEFKNFQTAQRNVIQAAGTMAAALQADPSLPREFMATLQNMAKNISENPLEIAPPPPHSEIDPKVAVRDRRRQQVHLAVKLIHEEGRCMTDCICAIVEGEYSDSIPKPFAKDDKGLRIAPAKMGTMEPGGDGDLGVALEEAIFGNKLRLVPAFARTRFRISHFGFMHPHDKHYIYCFPDSATEDRWLDLWDRIGSLDSLQQLNIEMYNMGAWHLKGGTMCQAANKTPQQRALAPSSSSSKPPSIKRKAIRSYRELFGEEVEGEEDSDDIVQDVRPPNNIAYGSRSIKT